jgi:hypothetical protein
MKRLTYNKVENFDDVNKELDNIRDIIKTMGIDFGVGTPEGKRYADYGTLYRNTKTGDLYIKRSNKEANTDWEYLNYTDTNNYSIVESDSNSNGSYIKFKDGTMICYMCIEVTDQSISNSYGSLYLGTRSWTYPVAFKTGTTPAVSIGIFKWGTSASWGTFSGVSNTSATLRVIDIASRATGTSTKISATAIGLWE